MSWVCCSKQHIRKVYPETTYDWYVNNDEKGTYTEKIIKFDPLKDRPEYKDWARIKIKSKNVVEMTAYLKENKEIFNDEDFPHSLINISKDKLEADDSIEWKRVVDIVHKPVFSNPEKDLSSFENFKSNNKVLNRSLVLISRTQPQKLLRILSKKLSPYGIYQFKLFKNGIVYNVIIDDFVPTFKGYSIFSGPSNGNEVYPMLLEKALAKLCKGYSEIPENPIEIMEMIYCGAIRREGLENLNNYEQLHSMVERALLSKGLTLMIAKNDKKIRNYGMNENEFYQIINQHHITALNGTKYVLYQMLSENTLSAWNGRFSVTDHHWKEIDEAAKIQIFKQMQKNHSFCIVEEEISRIFSQLITHEDTEMRNKDWVESYSESNYPSFSKFVVKEKDKVFIRITTTEKIRQSLILGKVSESNNFYYVSGSYSDFDNSLELSIQIEAGEYVICVLHDWGPKKEGQYIAYLSSTCRTAIIPQVKPIENFLPKLFTAHAVLNNLERSPSFGQCIYECGMGYLQIIIEAPKQIAQITINLKELSEEGWEVMQPFEGMPEVVLTSDAMILLRMSRRKPIQISIFPESAFKINFR